MLYYFKDVNLRLASNENGLNKPCVNIHKRVYLCQILKVSHFDLKWLTIMSKNIFSFDANEDVKNLTVVTSAMKGHATDLKGAMRWNFGTDFSARVTPLEVIERCDEMIARIQRWIPNIQKLKAEAQKQLANNNAKVREAYLDSLSDEELAQYMARRNAAPAANAQPAADTPAA